MQQLFQGAAAVGGQASVINNNCISNPIPGSGNIQVNHSSNSNGGSIKLPQAANLQSAPMSLQELEGRLRKENLHVGTAATSSDNANETLPSNLQFDGNVLSPAPKPNLLPPQMFTLSNSKGATQNFQNHQQNNINSEHSSTDASSLLMSPNPRPLDKLLLGSNEFAQSMDSHTPVKSNPQVITSQLSDQPSSSRYADPFLMFSGSEGLERLLINPLPKYALKVSPDSSGGATSIVQQAPPDTIVQGHQTTQHNPLDTTGHKNTHEVGLLTESQFVLALTHALQKRDFVRQLYNSYKEVVQQQGDNC